MPILKYLGMSLSTSMPMSTSENNTYTKKIVMNNLENLSKKELIQMVKKLSSQNSPSKRVKFSVPNKVKKIVSKYTPQKLQVIALEKKASFSFYIS